MSAKRLTKAQVINEIADSSELDKKSVSRVFDGLTELIKKELRKPNGELVSVTQRDKVPLALGERVLVIAGPQARVVPDYTTPEVLGAASPPTSTSGSAGNTPASSASETVSKPPEPTPVVASHPAGAAPPQEGATPPSPASAPAPTSLAAHPSTE